MPAEAQRGDLQSAKTQDSLLFTPPPPPPKLHFKPPPPPPPCSQWMAPLTPSTARTVGHMTVMTTPPRRGREASGCINEGAKGEEGPEADQTR
ncbi:prostate-associated microseminoprotein [Lates japonicus]|uniref:Prostate-associated microseminoprotein n=1 Tax=Lates japonicus TaxID=270547 RepID=A0AAD3R1K0_LATJO|nr:prostate-associated microseminoprotein [Lates japonicus]